MVIANCEAVRGAAEEFADQNGGGHPSDVGNDATPGGDTLTDLLPSGTLLVNPFTQANTEPIDGSAAQPGEVGYMVVRDAGGAAVGYYITGVGENAGGYIYEVLQEP